jgi:hypothetical protein
MQRYNLRTSKQAPKTLNNRAFLALSTSFSRSIPMFSAQSRLRHAVADTFAMVVYCTVVNMMIEIFSPE